MNTRRVRFLVSIAVLIGALSACSVFETSKSQPVIEDRITDWGLSKVGILATTPERRIVLVRMPDRLLCSEAPADVGETLAAAISASAKAEATGELTGLQAGISQQLATSILQLTYRSQGMQFYRDASYHLCIMFLNGIMSAEDVQKRHDALITMSNNLILQEIPRIAAIKGAASAQLDSPPHTPAAPLPSSAASAPARAVDAAVSKTPTN